MTPNHNAKAMVQAIMAERRAANKEKRDPCTSNVITVFRVKMRPKLSDDEINKLFEITFNTYLEITGDRAEYSNCGKMRD